MAESLACQSIFRDPPRPTVPLSGPHDQRLIAIVLAPLDAGETTHDGFRRKERELGAVFAALSLAEARALHARLANPRPADAVVACLGRQDIATADDQPDAAAIRRAHQDCLPQISRT